jgi:hypothetical protein
MYILRDEVEDSLPLPSGEKEVPLGRRMIHAGQGKAAAGGYHRS